MELINVKEVKEVRTIDEANELLSEGWVLLEIFNTAPGMLFIFGKSGLIH